VHRWFSELFKLFNGSLLCYFRRKVFRRFDFIGVKLFAVSMKLPNYSENPN
jgi:hypothetical protein